MAQRRFGPTRGAGTVIIEEEGQKQIEPAALGWAGYAGIVEKGPVGDLIIAANATQFARRCGGIIGDSLLPDAAADYYRLANGAGGLVLARVTDGNEVVAELNLYTRIGTAMVQLGKIKAHNGGRWGGKWLREQYVLGDISDLTETTLQMPTGETPVTDIYKGGTLRLMEDGSLSYLIISNSNTGLITVPSDQTMLTDHGGGAELRFYIELANESKAVSFIVSDGEEKPDEEFSIEIFVDGAQVKKYPNLDTDPTSARYWVSMINDDPDNYEIEAVDLWTGSHIATTRPANVYGLIETVTETLLTPQLDRYTVNSPLSGDATAVVVAVSTALPQIFTLTFSDPTTCNVVSNVLGDLGSYTIDTAFEPADAPTIYIPTITVSAGTNPMAAGDVMVIYYSSFMADELIGGYVYPDKPNSKNTKFRIVSNTHSTLTVAAGSDMTTVGEVDDEFLVEYPQQLRGGADGNAEIVDADYTQQAWDTANSPFNRVKGLNLGLVKMATPGVIATAVQKAGVAYAEAKNHQYRYEFPSNYVDEFSAVEYVNGTLGRNDFAVIAFPSYGYVSDPLGEGQGKRKLITITGMIHGREARIAANYDGYHKAQAGETATLPAILELPTGSRDLLEETLNPAGIQPITKKKGNFVIWGDRTLNVDPNWKWKHQREQMSYYEHVLSINFDWLIFQINDPIERNLAFAALQGFFLPEWRNKRALRGDTFEEAAIIKIDDEINTDATAAAGDMLAKVSLRLADTIERFIIIIGKQGVFDAVQ